MSAIGGIWSRDGAPIAASDLARLSSGLEQLGPDGEEVFLATSIAFLHRLLRVDAASGGDRQPWRSPHGIVIAWNGRLDNQGEVLREVRSAVSPTASAPELVAATYLLHGIPGFRRLIGDFCFSLWDERQQRLILATDAFGIRPLFYYQDRQRVVWSSRARATLAAASLPRELDDIGIAAFLTFIDAGTHTALDKIHLLPAAHALVVDREGERLESFWNPVPSHPIRYRSDRDYESHFRHLFQEAVSVRMPSQEPVWSDLSGGLDSSSIVTMGDEVLRQRALPASNLRTVSYVYDRSRTCDERPYIETVEAKRQQRGLHLRDDDYPVVAPIPTSLPLDLPSGLLPFHRRYQVLAREMEATGSRVLLRGSGGDHVLWGQVPAAFELADHLTSGRLPELWRSSRRWARSLKEPMAKTLWQGALWPILPRSLKRKTAFLSRLDGWFDPDFVSRVGLQDRLVAREVPGFQRPSDGQHWSIIQGVGRYLGWEFPLETGCIEARFPFLDRRLVEFALAIPIEQMLRPGETRSILRRSLRGILPETVRTRKSKAGADEAIYRGLVREADWMSSLFGEDARVVSRDFVDAAQLHQALAKARHGVNLNSAQLMRALTLEVWLRSLERTPPEAPPSPTIQRAFEQLAAETAGRVPQTQPEKFSMSPAGPYNQGKAHDELYPFTTMPLGGD